MNCINGTSRNLPAKAGFRQVENSELTARATYFCVAVHRCASIRKAERRPTNDPVRASSARSQSLLLEGGH
jgi:hypothetical protein